MMAIGAGNVDGGEAVLLYQSDDLYSWDYLSPLVVSDAQNSYVYECPNFFPLGDKWVLVVSVMPMASVEY
jgi:beta-fructofuranosidase